MPISELNIDSLGPLGDGVCRSRRGSIFVDRALPGDRLKARIRRDDRGVVRGEIVEIIEASEYRSAAPCPHFEQCGNCTLQHLNPQFYRSWKVESVKEALRKQGLRPDKWLRTIFIQGNSRRRVTLSAHLNRGKLVLGYYRRRSQEIVEITSCLVSEPSLIELSEKLKPVLRKSLSGSTAIDIFLQCVGETVDMVLTGPLGRSVNPEEFLKIDPIARVSWRKKYGEPLRVMAQNGPLTALFGSLQVTLPPGAFMQPTEEGEAALVKAVMAALPSKGHFADLFSGCGTFSGQMLARGPVDAYESNTASVKALTAAIGRNPLRVFQRDLVARPLRSNDLKRYVAVVFDPPRAGCIEQVIELSRSHVATLIGVSCNPATFARDARILREGGYWLQSVQVIDQFLWSHHMELVGVFGRRRTLRSVKLRGLPSKPHS